MLLKLMQYAVTLHAWIATARVLPFMRHYRLLNRRHHLGHCPGTRSMARIVQKYGGMLRFKQEGDTFVTQIVLSLKQ